MSIRTSKDLLQTIRSLDHIQLNRSYRKQYIAQLKGQIKMAKARYRAGVKGYTNKKHIQQLERHLKNLDKDAPFLEKIRVEVDNGR